MIASPCNGTCVLDPRSGFCRGCGRSGAEIAAWSSLPDALRLVLLAKLTARLDAMRPKCRSGG
jgi:predicted Fe-S protein YdhL (DUF1289 family)